MACVTPDSLKANDCYNSGGEYSSIRCNEADSSCDSCTASGVTGGRVDPDGQCKDESTICDGACDTSTTAGANKVRHRKQMMGCRGPNYDFTNCNVGNMQWHSG